jgi:leucine dehydrogenase
MALMGHEQVVYCHDEATGLRAIIAIHNTVLGPALGGTRFYNYATEAEALTDVLRLSRGMTFKAAVSGLNLGGGKAVIIGDPHRIKNEFLMRRFGKFVDSLAGKYITAEDVNIGVRDMEYVRMETRHVTGIPVSMGGSGNPSPVTAYGVFLGMKAALKYKTGSESLEGKRVIVQGVGSVGTYLCEHLHKAGAKLFVQDVWEPNLQRAANQFGATVVTEADVYTMDADVYAPCALGATLNPDTIPSLNVGIVAGAANNQLLDETRDGNALVQRGILYAPDFLINAGGLINVYTELEGYNKERALERAEGIYASALAVFERADREALTPHEAALSQALARIDAVGRIRQPR